MKIKVKVRKKGGPGSGNWNHKGRPGMVGGSVSGGGSSHSDYTISGAELGTLYHGGKHKISKVDPEMLQSRDSGYYGEGFYVTTNREFSKSYGKAVTTVQVDPKAKVLNVGGLTRDKAPTSLVDNIRKDYIDRIVRLRGEEFRGKAEKSFEEMSKSPTQWPSMVNGFAQSANYDIIKFSNGEIIIRNLRVIS